MLATGSGNVTIGGGRAGATEITAGSGNLLCTVALGLATHTFTTNSGNLSMAVPRGLAARIEAATTLGSVRADLPLVSAGQHGPRSLFGHRLVGSLGDGPARAEITLRTARGDIRLGWLDAAAPPAPPASPATSERADHECRAGDLPDLPLPPILPVPFIPPVPLTPSVEAAQRRVLEALAASQISVAEAEQLLAALAAQAVSAPGDLTPNPSPAGRGEPAQSPSSPAGRGLE